MRFTPAEVQQLQTWFHGRNDLPGMRPAFNVNAFPSVADAIADVPANGTLFFPAGTYDLSSGWTTPTRTTPLTIIAEAPGDVTITGASGATFIRPAAEVNVYGVGFTGWNTAFSLNNIPAATTVQRVKFERCRFSAMGNAIRWNTPNSGAVVSRFEATRCEFANLTGYATHLNGGLSSVQWSFNTVAGATSAALLVGDNTFADQNLWRRIVAIGNVIQNMVSPASGSTVAAILVYGQDCIIALNTVDGVEGNDDEAWGIYTKCRYGQVIGNKVKNLTFLSNTGGALATAINLKGENRAGSGSPQGYAVVCQANEIYLGGVANTNGIDISNDDIQVIGNLVDDPGTDGITSVTAVLSNINCSQNTIRGEERSGTMGIRMVLRGSSVAVDGNSITGMETGMRLAPGGGTPTLWSARHNKFKDITGTAIDVNPATTITNLDTTGNQIDTAANGIVYRGTAADHVTLNPNLYTNVTTPLTLTTAPTNLHGHLTGTAAWNPPDLAAGASSTTTVTVTGAQLGDAASAGFVETSASGISLGVFELTAIVSAANTVTVRLTNRDTVNRNLSSGTLTVTVRRV